MNKVDEPSSPAKFVDQIHFDDIEFLEIVGRGAFGTVQRAVWEGHVVAIKIIDINSGSGIKEYQDEVEQLSKVRHDNIIRLFGTSNDRQKVYIVMEYADCGSLYNLLHPSEADAELIPYNLGHVFSWSLQCAEAVEYLHSLTPKVIHRDLKPPNMLLLDHGKVLKICDFGTATQIHTEMTSNKGSAAWMAPEVFEGKRYSEKCDVYSFGIVLWEMLSRNKPFDEIGPPAFRILWAVYNGTRPPPLKGISDTLMKLMESCWAKDQSMRPSFSQIVHYFKAAEKVVTGADIPLFFDNNDDDYYNENVDSMREYVPDVSPNKWAEGNFFPRVEISPEFSLYQQISVPPTDEIPSLPQPFYPGITSHSSIDLSQPFYPGIISHSSIDLPQPFSHSSTDLPQPFYPGITSHNSIDYSQKSPLSFTSGSSTRTTPLSAGFDKSPVWTSPNQCDINIKNEIVHADWSLVPQSLMPIKPINGVETSVKMYDNYNEALMKYIDLQRKIKDLTVQKDNLDRQIKDVVNVQTNSAYYLDKYLKLDHQKSSLLELHNQIKMTLQNERARRNLNRSRSHTP